MCLDIVVVLQGIRIFFVREKLLKVVYAVYTDETSIWQRSLFIPSRVYCLR